ncbi:hypothetical protein RQP46_005816 [Phenoliferia psychrophenolica]
MAPDPYHEWVGPPEASRFTPQTAIQVAARSRDGKDVVIRCLTRAGEGHNVVAILDALSSPEARLDPSNHTLPMIDRLELDDMIFGVFPHMRPDGLTCIWFRTNDEVFKALDEVFEGFVYLHDRLIAHRPIPPEVLSGGPYCPFRMDIYQLGKGLHELFLYVTP